VSDHVPGSVLVVDDEPTIAEVVARYLERAGYETRVAPDGPAALEAAGERRVDLVVLDLMLPGIDGLEVMRRLRRGTGPAPAIILLTARGEESDRITGLRLGADDYVVKPFSPGEDVALTVREFELLAFLARHAGQAFTREELMERVWRFSFYTDTSTVTVHVRRLRSKLEPDPDAPRLIETVWGVGYRFASQP
jgi:two-component system response regulator ResD